MQIAGYALLALVLLVAVSAGRQYRLKRACHAAFARVYSNWSPPPRLEVSSMYGYPAFKVLFNSKPEIAAAAQAGLNQEYIRSLDELCKNQGSKSRPFSAEVAVFFTYKGHSEELRSRANKFTQRPG